MKRSDLTRILAAVYNVGLIVILRPTGEWALVLMATCAVVMLAYMLLSWLYARAGK